MTDNSSELPSKNLLEIKFKSKSYPVPIVENLEELQSLTKTRLRPNLAKAIILNGGEKNILPGDSRVKTGIAFVEYVYQLDEARYDSKRTLQNMGLSEEHTDSLINSTRRIGFHPYLETMVNGIMSENRDWASNCDSKSLPFEQRTFVIGPMAIDWSAIVTETGPGAEEDENACSFLAEGSIAIDGVTLMAMADFKRRDEQITNGDIITILTRVGILTQEGR